MEELKILLQKILNKDLQQIILSNSRHPEQTQKVKIRPVLIREELLFQETAYPAGHRSGQQKGQADTEGEKQWQGTADGGGGCF